MTSLLPDSFRCFGHIEFIYARNVPLKVRLDGTVADAQTDTVPVDVPTISTRRGLLITLSGFAPSVKDSHTKQTKSASTVVYRSELCQGTQHPTWRLLSSSFSASLAACTAFTVELRSPRSAEAQRRMLDEQNPSLSCSRVATLPPGSSSVLQEVEDTALLARIQVDTRRLRYVGASVAQTDDAVASLSTEAHMLAGQQQRYLHQQRRQGSGLDVGSPFAGDPGSDFCLYFKCTDGVFALSTDPVHTTREHSSAPPPSTKCRFGASGSVEWSRSPAGCGFYTCTSTNLTRPFSAGYDGGASNGGDDGAEFSNADPSRCMTVGDVRALAAASLSWKYLQEITDARRKDALNHLDAAADARKAQVAEEVARATAQSALNNARERLTLASLELEQVRADVQARQELRNTQEEAVRNLQDTQRCRASPAVAREQQAEQRRQELARADARSRLSAVQRARTAELAKIFPIVLSTQYATALRNIRNAKDSIGGHLLPVFLSDRDATTIPSPTATFPNAGFRGDGEGSAALLFFPGEKDVDVAASVPGLVASSTDDLFEEATAMGHVAHVVQVLSALYACPVPHPPLVAGAHSRVLVRANLSPQRAAQPVTGTGDDKLPLSCQRAAERPLLKAALALILRDCVFLARAMDRDEARVLAFGFRVGAVLKYLFEG